MSDTWSFVLARGVALFYFHSIFVGLLVFKSRVLVFDDFVWLIGPRDRVYIVSR